MVGWPARVRRALRAGLGGGLDADAVAGAAAASRPSPRRAQAVEWSWTVESMSPPARHGHVAEAQRVGGAVGRAQLDPDRDERRHAHHARRDPAAAAGEQRERARGLLVARAAGLVLGRLGRRRLGFGPAPVSCSSVSVGVDSVVVVSAGVLAAGAVEASSSSSPQAESANTRATRPEDQISSEFSPRNADGSYVGGRRCRRPWTHGNRLVGVDLTRRRVWVCGQRVHHGATGIILAAFGAVLVAHDWKDRPLWFRARVAGQGLDRRTTLPAPAPRRSSSPPVRSSTSS